MARYYLCLRAIVNSMNDLWTTFSTAIAQLLSGDPELWGIVGVSFSVSASALLIALLPALSAGFTLAYFRFPGRWVAISLLNSLLAVLLWWLA